LNYTDNHFFFFSSSDQDLLSAAAWYQEGLPEDICEEYLNNQPIGSFIIRCSYIHSLQPFILSVKTTKTSIKHFFIQQTIDNDGYQIQVSLRSIYFLRSDYLL